MTAPQDRPGVGLLDDCPALEQAVVSFIQDLTYDDLDEATLEGVGRLLRDQLSLQIGISAMPWSAQILAYVQAQQRPGVSTVAASTSTMSAIDAAFINGSYGHGFEYDDAHGPSESHPGSAVIPAAMAIGEELGSTMAEVITALVAGYEVYARLGILASPELLSRGYQPHSVLSVFGAAAVAAKLRGFDAETTLNALAIALSYASGTTEYTSTGGSIKRAHAGIGTRGGMSAADMAAAGITGPRSFLTGNKGFFWVFSGRAAADDAATRFGVNRRFEIADNWLKAYCACYCTHAYIDAMRPFADRVDEIAAVQLRIHPAFDVVVGNKNVNAFAPRTIEHVQYSLPTQAAFALLGIGNGYRVHRDYLAGDLDMTRTNELITRITISPSEVLAAREGNRFVGDATVTFADGSSEDAFVANAIGTDVNPMPRDEQEAKFFELTVDTLGEGRARALLATLTDIDPTMTAAQVMRMCRIERV